MATPGKKLDEPTIRQIEKMRADGFSLRKIASAVQVALRTVQKYLRPADGPRRESIDME
jgi:hypothetical protein